MPERRNVCSGCDFFGSEFIKLVENDENGRKNAKMAACEMLLSEYGAYLVKIVCSLICHFIRQALDNAVSEHGAIYFPGPGAPA